MTKFRKFSKYVINTAVVIFMFSCFSNIEKWVNPFWSLVGAIVAMLYLAQQAYKAGWCYEWFYDNEEGDE